jgi:phage portal protein BeeE
MPRKTDYPDAYIPQNWGNFYAEVERLHDGTISALRPIHPTRVTPKRDEGNPGPIWYEVQDDSLKGLP